MEQAARIPFLSSDKDTLEAVCTFCSSPVALVFTHPYAPLGGSMDNNVVLKLFAHFAHKGYNVVRFNFRGVGASNGSGSWSATSETDDVRAVCSFLVNRHKITRIVLVGYSYGSVCASAVADDFPEVLGFVSIAYPFSYLWALTFFNSSKFLEKAKTQKPKLFVVGTLDNFTGIDAFRKYVEGFPEPKKLDVIRGADHFFFGIEEELTRHVDTWITDLFMHEKYSK